MAQVRSHVTAHADPLSMLVYASDNVLQEVEEAWMPHVREARDPGIVPIDGKEILAQIIGADAEEVQFPAKLLQNESHGRNLNHHAERYRGIESDLPRPQILLDLRDFGFNPEHLFHGRDHGNHELDAAEG